MKLSDVDILERMRNGSILIDPLASDACVGPVSVDLTLATGFMTFRHARTPALDLADKIDVSDLMETVTLAPGDSFYLQPGEFALGSTQERVGLPHDLVGKLDGRSSLGRMGLMVHATAHTIEPGFRGQITLEFFNAGKLALGLRPGMRICSLSFETLSQPAQRGYDVKPGAKYRDQMGPQASRIGRD